MPPSEILVVVVGIVAAVALLIALLLAEDVPSDGAARVIPRLGRLVLRIATFGRIRRAPPVDWLMGLVALLAMLCAGLWIAALVMS